jgi:hypothetical protein
MVRVLSMKSDVRSEKEKDEEIHGKSEKEFKGNKDDVK